MKCNVRSWWELTYAPKRRFLVLTQKFVFRSALRPNQISFSHSQDPERTIDAAFFRDAQRNIAYNDVVPSRLRARACDDASSSLCLVA
jgi:hypothetical protein